MRYKTLRYFKDGYFDMMREPIYHKVDDSFMPIEDNTVLTDAAYVLRIKAEVNNMFYCTAATGETNYKYIVIDETHPLFNHSVMVRAMHHISHRQEVYDELIEYLEVAARDKIYDIVMKEIGTLL